MAKISDVNFEGASGTNYGFAVYPANEVFNNIGVVYIFTKRTKEGFSGKHKVLYVGQTAELKDRLSGHEKLPCGQRNGMNCICIYRDSTEDSRLKIETDLRRNYDPVCNKQ